MAGIYLHIPFCRKACHYCDFHFSTSLQYKKRMLAAMHQELEFRQDFIGWEKVSTIYFGGGTPSVLSASEINAFLNKIGRLFEVESELEITLEANPDDLDLEYLKELRSAGINRLSIGIQSFDEAQLSSMNRSHSATQALACLENAHTAGFSNISADLIFALPQLSDVQLKKDAQRLVDFDIPHISAYCLTVEEGTVLHHQVKKGEVKESEEGQALHQFLLLDEILTAKGYEHYEVSNYAKSGMRSKHNAAYWDGIPYLGLGPSAHSYSGNARSWTPSNNARYMKALEKSVVPLESEELSLQDRYNEFLMVQLRKTEGVSLSEISSRFGVRLEKQFGQELDIALANGLLVEEQGFLKMSKAGWFSGDAVASSLFWVD